MIAASVCLLGLLLLVAFLAGAETALIAASKPLMHHMEHEGHPRAARVNRLLDQKDRMLAAVLVGQTLLVSLIAALTTHWANQMVGVPGLAYAVLAVAAVTLIFGEIIPKTIALHHANKLALAIAPAMTVFVVLVGPLVHLFHVIARALLSLVGIKAGPETDIEAAMAELRGAIEVHASEQEVREERKMLRSILDLDDVTVSDVMTHRKSVTTIDAELPAHDAVDSILRSPFTRIPIWRDTSDNIIGVVHAKDVLRAVRSLGSDVDKLDVVELAAPPWFIPDSTTLLEQLRAFRERREHFALVVDEYGTLMGVVTLEDILEEIVGDIADEHDVSVAGVHPQTNGSYVVDGTVTLRDLNREFDWSLPDDQAATIAGLLLYESRQIPNVGQVFSFYGFRFEVVRRHRNQITSIRMTPPSGAQPPEED